MPASKTRRAALGGDYARDGRTLLRAVWDPASPSWLARLPAVGVLQRVLIQNVVVDAGRGGREVIRLREADTDGLPPGRCRIVSPYDTDAGWGGKRDLTWLGYKPHISESCDAEAPPAPVGEVPDTPPNLITNVATTDASVPDAAMTEPIHTDLARRGVSPDEHYVDSVKITNAPASPLPRTAQDPPATQHHGRSPQPHPARRLVQRRDPRPPPDHPPHPPGPHPRSLNKEWPTGSST